MNNWIVIQNELSALDSSLPSEKIGEGYTVPEGYFDKFVSSVWERIQAEEVSSRDELFHLSPFLSRISKKMPFSVPDDYFTETAGQIPALIKEDPLLPGLGKSMPYQLPENYFEQFPATLLELVKQPREEATELTTVAKVITMRNTSWVRYAAAAVMAGVITLGGIFYFNSKQTSGGSPEDWLANKLENVSTQDLEDFIKATDISYTAVAKSEQAPGTEVRTLLNDVPDTELQRFLDEIPADNEDLLMIN